MAPLKLIAFRGDALRDRLIRRTCWQGRTFCVTMDAAPGTPPVAVALPDDG